MIAITVHTHTHTDLEKDFISAAKDNDTKTMKKLLMKGLDVNCRHSLGWNALHAAVANGHWAAVRLLVESGADVNAKDEFSSAQRVAAQRRISSLLGMIISIYWDCVLAFSQKSSIV